jgi:hypothetical protein
LGGEWDLEELTNEQRALSGDRKKEKVFSTKFHNTGT